MISPLVGTGTFCAAFLLGALPTGLFTLVKDLGRVLNWSADESERGFRRGFVMPTIVLLPLAGGIVDLWGAKDAAVIGLVILTVGLALSAMTPTPQALATNLLGLAAGTAFLAVGLVSWMPALLSEQPRAVAGLNLGFIFVSLGWLIGPMFVERARRWVSPRAVFFSGSALAALSCLILGAIRLSPTEEVQTAPLGDPRFWLLLAAAALYLPVESCLEVWSGPFLRDLGDRRYLRSRIFGFWCAYLAARFATFWLVRTGFEPWFLLACTAVSAMILGNLVGAYGPSSGGFGFLCVGFCYGPLLPGFLGLFAQTFPDRIGLIVGCLFAAGAIYHVLLGPILHRYTLNHTPREAMRVPVVLTLLLAAPLLLATLMM
jgi:MFS family permease